LRKGSSFWELCALWQSLSDAKCAFFFFSTHRTLEFYHGVLATNTLGSVVLKEGKISLLATVCSVPSLPHRPKHFQVDYREKQISLGKFLAKKERESDREMGISSTVERSLAPLFRGPLQKDVQVVVSLLSSDSAFDSDVHVFNAASAALLVSPLPWAGPVAAVRVVHTKDGLVVNPAPDQRSKATADLLFVGTKDGVMSLDFFGREVSPVVLLDALQLARRTIQPIIAWQQELVAKSGVTKPASQEAPGLPIASVELTEAIQQLAGEAFREVLLDPHLSLANREAALLHLQSLTRSRLKDVYPYDFEVVEGIISFRNSLILSLLHEGLRSDGRPLDRVRKESSFLGFLPPVAHGSALFQRGDIQVSYPSSSSLISHTFDLPN